MTRIVSIGNADNRVVKLRDSYTLLPLCDNSSFWRFNTSVASISRDAAMRRSVILPVAADACAKR